MKNSISKLLFKLFLLTIGVLTISWIICARLIRERLPRDIPFNLSEIGLYILLALCCIYLYIVIKLLRPSVPQPIFEDIRNYIILPLITLDETIKNNKYIKPIHLSFIRTLVNLLTVYNNNEKIQLLIYFSFCILPRIILINILCIDVFYFKKLFYIYKIIWIGIFPLLHRYIKYSLKYAQEEYTKELESSYYSVIIHECQIDEDSNITTKFKDITLREYIELEIDNQYFETGLQYNPSPNPKNKAYNDYKVKYKLIMDHKYTKEDYNLIEKLFYDLIYIIIYANVFIKEYALSTEKK